MPISKREHSAVIGVLNDKISNLEVLLRDTLNGEAIHQVNSQWRVIVRNAKHGINSATACAVFQLVEDRWQVWSAGETLGGTIAKAQPLVDHATDYGRAYGDLRNILADLGARQ